MRNHLILGVVSAFLLILFPVCTQAQNIQLPEWIVEDVSYTIPVSESSDSLISINNQTYTVHVDEEGNRYFEMTFSGKISELEVQFSNATKSYSVSPIPLFTSVIPPLIAIILALITREVITSLFLGIFSGTAIIGLYTKGIAGFFTGFLAIFDRYVLSAMNDSGHLSIILFSMTIGAIVTVISKNGGMQGVVNKISVYAKDARSGQLATYFLGIAIFFDDYANTLVVGNTMRAVTDQLKISREKLAYLVDSTAAPIAALAFVTTWIGAELGYIEDGVRQIPQLHEGAYSIFLNSLSYSFYPILTLIFMFMLIWTRRDFGPMYSAEKYARTNDVNADSDEHHAELEEFTVKRGAPVRAFNAIIPIAVIILGTLIGLLYTGFDAEVWQNTELGFFRKLSIIIGNSDSYVALLWSSLTGLLVAVLMTTAQRIMNLEETISSAISGYKTMVTAMMILILAWALAQITDDLHTAHFLKSLWSNDLSPTLLPAVTFILSAIVSFSTGSSWGTMAILYPLLLPAGFAISLESGLSVEETMPLFYNMVSCVLAGSVLGDHCSPISDTTILSSLASGCNHIQHVKTQMPYALSVGVVSILVGTIGTAFGLPIFVAYLIGILALGLIIRNLGKVI